MMYRDNRRVWRTGAVAAALAAVSMAGIGTSSAAAPPTAAAPCISGYLCIQELNGSLVLVPGGQSESFSPAITTVSITNFTSQAYCITTTASFGLPSGATDNTFRTVYGVGPGPVCAI